MIKVALIGYGKMGKTIETLIERDFPDMQVVLKINRANLDTLNASLLQSADVAIEFTTPNTAASNIHLCFEADIPVVCGTTGWYEALNDVKQFCVHENKTLLYATNFSVGVNIFFEINKKLAQLMNGKNYQASISETHHAQKLDIPSGTAVTLAEQIIQEHASYAKWQVDSEEANSLPIHAFREEHVPGTHVIRYENEIDFIEIKHEAKSREGFAQGAILAARWILNKKGFFGMQDVLQIN